MADMSLQYLAKTDPPSYNPTAVRRGHEYIPTSEQTHTNNIENKTQQHSINDILNSSKQGKYLLFIVFMFICYLFKNCFLFSFDNFVGRLA